ncbi:hypothetical protein CDG81_12495 [Actinopolyspora erythraea]|uniref:N-acetyltransferase n=1 Tax=Actinopolyspora erythraea TaxID=414996 RepID=A0A099D5J0_9ACTN|nr:hypothetical protein [Actinopolyspora erythraea]ASU78968.1 hypothetical protein CDG81_12495 [Actinopolyspora erythraea]KGI81304.1 hypothetical protein IL38_12575 [Actinopolyspora erythraea]
MPTDLADTAPRVASLAERPDLEPAMLAMDSSWPDYIRPDPVLVHWAFERHARHQLVALDEEADEVTARAASVPLRWSGATDDLPDTGWDEALRQCLADTHTGREPNTLCALEVAVAPDRKARKLSGRLLEALKEHARGSGYHSVVVPVRPSRKHTRPDLSMSEYLALTRPDGLPEDPWLRVHVRLGGQPLKICPVSMTISGSLAQWREWTGLPFDTSGPLEVPGALAPVVVDVEHDHATYVEPNVWVRHALSEAPQRT